MRRRTVAWIVGSLLLTGTVLVLAWVIVPPAGQRLSVENFPHIRPGMTQAEVEGLLGGPPGNYGRYPEKSGFMTQEGYRAPPGSVEKVWFDDAHRFEVYFDQEGRVVGQHKRAEYHQSFFLGWPWR